MRLWFIMQLWLIFALLSLITFVLGLLSMRKVNKYVLNNSLLEGKPSILRKKTAVILIIAYVLLFVGFIIYYFQLLP